MKWRDGRMYTGQFRNGHRQGQGTMIWPDGSKYTGQWLFDDQHGYREFTDILGQTRQGEWDNGLRIRWIDN